MTHPLTDGPSSATPAESTPATTTGEPTPATDRSTLADDVVAESAATLAAS